MLKTLKREMEGTRCFIAPIENANLKQSQSLPGFIVEHLKRVFNSRYLKTAQSQFSDFKLSRSLTFNSGFILKFHFIHDSINIYNWLLLVLRLGFNWQKLEHNSNKRQKNKISHFRIKYETPNNRERFFLTYLYFFLNR